MVENVQVCILVVRRKERNLITVLVSLFSIILLTRTCTDYIHVKPALKSPRIRVYQSGCSGQSRFVVLKAYKDRTVLTVHLEENPTRRAVSALLTKRHDLHQHSPQNVSIILPDYVRRESTWTFKKELTKGSCKRNLSTEKVFILSNQPTVIYTWWLYCFLSVCQ